MNRYYETSQIILIAEHLSRLLEVEHQLNATTNIQTIAIPLDRFLNNKFHYRRDTLFVIWPSSLVKATMHIRGQQLGPDFQIHPWKSKLEKLLEKLPCTIIENA